MYKLQTNNWYLFGYHTNALATFEFETLAECAEAISGFSMRNVHIRTPNGTIYAVRTQWDSYIYDHTWHTIANWKRI